MRRKHLQPKYLNNIYVREREREITCLLVPKNCNVHTNEPMSSLYRHRQPKGMDLKDITHL